MERINFEDGKLVKAGSVTIDGIEYETVEAQYSGDTPLSAYIMNKLQDNIEKSAIIISATEPTSNEKVWIKNTGEETKIYFKNDNGIFEEIDFGDENNNEQECLTEEQVTELINSAIENIEIPKSENIIYWDGTEETSLETWRKAKELVDTKGSALVVVDKGVTSSFYNGVIFIINDVNIKHTQIYSNIIESEIDTALGGCHKIKFKRATVTLQHSASGGISEASGCSIVYEDVRLLDPYYAYKEIYTPIEPYSPANKKYVDDQISQISTGESTTSNILYWDGTEETSLAIWKKAKELVEQEGFAVVFMTAPIQYHAPSGAIFIVDESTINNEIIYSNVTNCKPGAPSGTTGLHIVSETRCKVTLTYSDGEIIAASKCSKDMEHVYFLAARSDSKYTFTPSLENDPTNKKYVDNKVANVETQIGDISTILDTINGEVV